MKKIILLFIFTISISINGQLLEKFEGSSLPVAGIWTLESGDWRIFDNGVGTIQSWNGLTSATFSYTGIGRSANVLREFVVPGGTTEDWLVMPLKQMRVNEQLRFYTRQGFLGNDGSIYQIRVSTNINPALQSAYSTIKSYTEDQLIGPAPSIFSQYDEKIIDLTGGTPNYLGQNVYIAFVKVYTRPIDSSLTSAGDRWLIDNVQLAQKCLTPINLGFTNIGTTKASLKWDTIAGVTYEVQYGATPININDPSTYTQYTVNNGNPSTLANIITGLSVNTAYQFRVRAVCGPGITSDWSILFPFNTLNIGATCAEPIAFNSLPYSDADDTLNFGDNLTQNGPGGVGCGATGNFLGGTDVVYSYTVPLTGGPSQIRITMNPLGKPGTGVFVYANCANVGNSCLAGVANDNNTIRTISPFNVTPGATYTIVISSLVTTFSFDYVLTVQAITCPLPTFLNATNINQTSATLGWTSSATTTSWEYQVQTEGSNIPSGSGVSTNLFAGNNINTYTLANGTLAPMMQGINYQYWVRSQCGTTGTFSPWAGPFPFQTSQCPNTPGDQCGYSFIMTDTQAVGQGWNGSRMEIRQNGLVLATIGEQVTGASATYIAKLCDDLSFELFWANGGVFASEVGVSIVNSFGQTLFFMPPGSQALVGTILYPVPTVPVTVKRAECDYPECQPPTGLGELTTTGAVTTNSAKVKWNIPTWTTSANTYDIYVTSVVPYTAPLNGQTPAVSAPQSFYYPNVLLTGTPPSFDLTGLTQDTQYRFWVRTNCANNGPSDWSAGDNFTTKVACPKATALNVVVAGTPAYTTLPTQASVFWTTPASPIVTSWWVIAVPAPAPPAVAVTPGFDPATWVQVLTNPTNAVTAFALGGGVGANNTPLLPDTDYNYYVVSDCNATGSGLSNVAGPKLFRTRPTCFRPTNPNVTAASITTTSATFTWTKGEAINAAWEILCVPQPDTTLQVDIPPALPAYPGQLLFSVPAASATIVGNNVTFALPTGSLVTAQIYNYFIRTVCSATDKSKWTLVKLFNTLPCNTVDKCNYKIVLTNLALPLPIDNDWFGARIQVRQNGIVVATVGGSGINSGIPIDVPMCPGVSFDLFWSVPGTQSQEVSFTLYNPFSEQIYQYNAATQASPFVPYVVYASTGSCTPIGCVLPATQPVVAATVTAFNALIDWTPNGSETQWEIVAMPLASDAQPVDASPLQGTPTGVNVGNKIYYLAGSHPFTLTGLTPDTDYVYYIRAVCSATNTSVWNLVPIPFKTKIACYQPATISLFPNSQTTTSVSLWWTNNPLNTSTTWNIIAVPVGTIPTNASIPTGTYTGVIPNPSAPFILNGLTPGVTYEIYVRTNCSELNTGSDNYGTSKWTGPSPAVTTDPTCYPPINLAWINDSANPAELTWSPNPNQVGTSQWTVYTQIYTGAVNPPIGGGIPVNTVVTPTAIQYTIRDSFGNISNTATIGVGLIDITPIASNDVANYFSPVSINVITNDTSGDTVLASTVSLVIPAGGPATTVVVDANGDVTAFTVPNQGTWAVNPTSGAITFTRNATFTGIPAAIQYNIEDQEGNQSNNATISFVSPAPIAIDNQVFYTTGTVIIPVLINDTIGGTVLPSTVSLVPAATGVTGIVTDTNQDVTAMTITGEGTWTVNTTTGAITFAPVSGFTGFPLPIQYNVEDILAVQSNNATVTLSNVDILPIATGDTQPLVAGVNTISVLTNDNTGDIVVPGRVSLIVPIGGATGTASDALLDVISFNIPLQGKWAVNITTGVITFTPLPGFTGAPTPIQYTVRDAQLNISNPATITLTSLLPIATNDSLPFTNNSIASVNATVNDTTGGVVVANTLSLIPPTAGAIEIVTNTAVTPNVVTSFRVPNEGRWTVVNGVVTFTPILSYTTAATGPNALAPGFYEFYIASNCGPIGTSTLVGPQYFSVYADPVICAAINLDLGTNLNSVDVCDDDTCTNLTANYNDIFDTSSYSMLPVKYTNLPFPYTGGPGATNLNITIDDVWSPVTQLPFKFCFFGTNSQQVWVGSNGVITFSNPGSTTCAWQFNQQQIPSAAFPIKNAVYGVYQDTDPAVVTNPDPHSINYGVVGEAPCRAFVVNFENITQFGFNSTVTGQTSQIVLYETSNIIEVYVKKRTPEIAWQQGQGVLGIQNATGDLAFVPPGKNTGAWTIKEEAYRFTPAGASVVEFEWKDANNATISTAPTINVCPTVTTVYTASATYTSCGLDPVNVTKPVTVKVNSVEVVDMEDVTACGNYVLPVLPVGNYFTEANGGGSQKNAGDLITSDTTLYIFATTAAGITPTCTDEDVFKITIKNPSTPISTGNINVCALNPIQTITADAFVNDDETIVWFDAANNVVVAPTWNQLGTTTYFAESAYQSNDYTDLPAPTTITIPAGQSSATVSVTTSADSTAEGIENFFIKGQVTSANTRNNYISGKVNLFDDASQVVVSINDLTVVEGSVATFKVSLSNASTVDTTISVVSANGTALSGTDYIAIPVTIVSIPAGSLFKLVSTPTILDTTAELEKFSLLATVTSTNTFNTSAAGTATISELPSLPTVMISNESVVEGGVATFTISLSKVSTQDTVIDLKSVDGTAINIDCRGAARTPVSLTLFELLPPVAGGLQEACSTFPTVQTLTATATPSAAGQGVNWYNVASGGLLLTTPPSLNAVGVKTYYAESFVINTDYTATQGTITIPAGQTTATINVPTLTDSTIEPNESFYLNATITSTNTLNSNIVGTALISGVAAKPTVFISKPTVVEGTNAIFTISLSQPSLFETKIIVVTSDGTAISGADYTTLAQQVVIPAGSTTVSVTVVTLVDAIADTAETLTLTATIVSTNTANTSIVSSAVITETADLPTVSISNPIGVEGSNTSFIVTLSTPSIVPTVISYLTNPYTAGPGCASPTRSPVKLEIFALPAAPVIDPLNVVTACLAGSAQTLTAIANPPVGSSVVWYNAATGGDVVPPLLTGLGTATYYAESVSNLASGCRSGLRTKVDLEIQDLPKFTLFGNCVIKDFTIQVVPEANFDLATATYKWKNVAGQIVATTASFVALAVGNYTCEVINTKNCSTTVTYSVVSVSCAIQKGISPKGLKGGDGNNDYFDLEGLNATKVQIFNRYGLAVYSKENYVKEWYGQSDDDNELPDGTYYYVIERNNEDPLTGWIYINREQ